MKTDKIYTAVSAAAWILVLLGVMLTVIDVLCFCRPFYSYEYKKGSQAEKIGISDADLMNATDTLLDYIRDERDDIVVEAEVNGSLREVYDNREKLHMIDVKNLYQNAMTWRTVMAAAGILMIAGIVLSLRSGSFALLQRGYKYALMMLMILIAFIAVSAVADFNSFWLRFHYIFFDNDLFLLNPNTSIMINMFPESFFFDMVILIAGVFAAFILLTGFVLKRLQKRFTYA